MSAETAYRVFADGIYDLFHKGHENSFKLAIKEAEKRANGRKIQLIIGVNGDGVTEYKRKSIMSLAERCNAVWKNKYVYNVIKNSPLDGLTKEFLEEHKIDLVVHGNDFTEKNKRYYYGEVIDQGKYAEVPYTVGVSTTQLIREAKEQGKFSQSPDLTLLKESVLIGRIRQRTWKELNVTLA